MKNTKIICTIGPASQNPETIKKLILAGMNVARLNFSHGSYEEQTNKFHMIQDVSGELGIPVAILQDTKGPEIRLRDFADGKEELKAGQKFTLTTEEIVGTNEKVSITYKQLPNDVEEGMAILLDDGLIELKVDKVTATDIECTVINGGFVSNKKGVNVPGAELSMPFISDVDREDILFGIKMGFDFLACSFVRSKADILEVRKILDENNAKTKVIAKIENMQGIRNLSEILEVSDGIMVARGDMGVEIPLEEVPVIQKKMIKKAIATGKQVITATQMLESMTKNPRPTRAETTDVANAIYDGTTAIMLSGETASGQYPVEAVETMTKIAQRTELDIDYINRFQRQEMHGVDVTNAISHATCTTAMDLKATAIITVTMSGFTAEMIARYKPNCPIIACSVDERVCRQVNMLWGVRPLLIDKKETAEELFKEGVRKAMEAGYVKKGDTVVITAGVPLGISGKTNMIRVVEV
ncbi:MAG: pyruvate kinase [Lachnospiraceae bacterium]|nr:pyruvate kinase [Lachnospiraceae bacterium]